MKTFEDLEFKPHAIAIEAENTKNSDPELWNKLDILHDNLTATHAKMLFTNGNSISVIFGSIFYSNGIDTYEAMSNTENEPRGYLTKEEVTEFMKELQA